MKSVLKHSSKLTLTVSLACALCASTLRAQQAASAITLREAVDIALEKNPEHKTAVAEKRAASAEVGQARAALLPQLAFSETALRGNDPVFAFGARLRQRSFTAADFGLNVLNAPAPIGDFASRFGGDWNLFDSFSSWHAMARAKLADKAAGHQLEFADQEIVFGVVKAYYDVLLAKKETEIASQAVATARAILDRSKDRLDAGLVAQSDYLNAQVRLAERGQELISAQNNVEVARGELNAAMGVSPEMGYDPTDVLAEKTFTTASLEEEEKNAVENRPDLKRLRSEKDAQSQGVSAAKSAFGPRVNAFADWELDNPTFVAGGGGNNWLAGIEVQFDLFEGGAKRAELAHEEGLRDEAASTEEAATNAARLEVRRAYYAADTARQQIAVARAAIAESQDSLRVSQDRYESGLLTIIDLLSAEEAARRSQADYWQDLYHYYVGYAALQLASGTLGPRSPIIAP